MPTLTLEYTTDAERLVLEQAVAYVRSITRLALDAPHGTVPAACERMAVFAAARTRSTRPPAAEFASTPESPTPIEVGLDAGQGNTDTGWRDVKVAVFATREAVSRPRWPTGTSGNCRRRRAGRWWRPSRRRVGSAGGCEPKRIGCG